MTTLFNKPTHDQLKQLQTFASKLSFNFIITVETYGLGI